ncbi:four-carbon acid sugar kinase family protein [Spirosoma taeanense]|uniref:four-carbon acid sugar kinase family protein n=1 Tax=Spirosoma taeanense TaxID=2735870 RepID=UPI001F0383E3|nr:four-carbon acid sugar kinase family protein [Spirosoma taeanense]
MLPAIREEFIRSEKTIVVLDDDPTGTQTCYDVTVLTSWRVALIAEELRKKPSILYILTNSRSLPEQEAVDLTLEVGSNVNKAAQESGRQIVVISRSDSTLRGHFPAEVDAIARTMNMQEAVIVFIPAFIEGGRFTLNDVHYIVENETLVPVSDTPFAHDVVFGYKQANLKQWVEEKTAGRIRAEDVNSISIEDIRIGGPQAVSEQLTTCAAGTVCVVNAASYRDLEVVVMGLLLAEKQGKTFLYRSSATFVPIRAGLESSRMFLPRKEDTRLAQGALVIVGSHVPKTTRQLFWLLENGHYRTVEVNVGELLHSEELANRAELIGKQTDGWLANGEDVVLYTSRRLEAGPDPKSSLMINALVSDFLVSILKGLTVRPKFIVAKGGITSSDLASKGLATEKAMVLGPVIPGVPVWQMDAASKFPGILYVVFPGNVGDETALLEVCRKLGG